MSTLKEITKNDIVEIVKLIYRRIDKNKDYLSKLDTEIGDGDHGFSMAGGFKSFYDKLDEFAGLDIGQLLKKGGFELIKTIGGAAGAIFGTFFTGQASYYEKNLKGSDTLTLRDLAQMFSEALEQIKKRGNAQPGNKTMVDAFEPAVNILLKGAQENLSFGEAFENASKAADEGAEKTKTMVATRGRSKNLGERSKGFIDPGAKSMSIIIRTMADYFSQRDQVFPEIPA